MLKKLLPAALATLLVTVFTTTAIADEAAVRKNFETRFKTKAESVTKTGYLGLYEIYADGQIVYADDKGSAFIIGALVDGKTMRNVTQERINKLSAIQWSDLPLDRAVKQVRGNGKRVLATFEDPNCGYCKRLAKDLQKLDNVTIYTFLYPILSQDSVDKAKAIWCASDRPKAWNDWMIDGKAPGAKTDCDATAVTKNQEYGQKLNITGTPTLFFADGDRMSGARPLQAIEEKLGQIGAR